MLEVNAPNQHVEEYRTLYSGKGKNWFDPTDPPFPMQASAPKGYRAKAKSWTQDLAQTDNAATLLAKEKKRVHELKSALIEEAVKAHMKERKLENGLVREAVVAHRRKNELLNAQPQMATAHKAQTKKLASFWKHPGMDKGGVFGAIKPEHALTPEYLSQPLYTDETNEILNKQKKLAGLHLNFSSQIAVPQDPIHVDPFVKKILKAVAKGKGFPVVDDDKVVGSAPQSKKAVTLVQQLLELEQLEAGAPGGFFSGYTTKAPATAFEMPELVPPHYQKIYDARKKMANMHMNLTGVIAPLIAEDPELKAIVKAMQKDVAAAEKNENQAKLAKNVLQKLSFWQNPGKDKGGFFGDPRAFGGKHPITQEYLDKPMMDPETAQYLANEREKVLQHLNFTAQLAAPYDQALVDPELKAVGKGKGKVMLEVNAPNQHVEEYRTLYSGKGKNWFDPTEAPFMLSTEPPHTGPVGGYKAVAVDPTQSLAELAQKTKLLGMTAEQAHLYSKVDKMTDHLDAVTGHKVGIDPDTNVDYAEEQGRKYANAVKQELDRRRDMLAPHVQIVQNIVALTNPSKN